MRCAACIKATASASVPTIRMGRQMSPARRIFVKSRRATMRSIAMPTTTNPSSDTIHSLESALNWSTNEKATITPMDTSDALTIRRSSSAGRSTALDWYSLFRENETIHTGYVSVASTRCVRCTPSWASERTMACQTNASTIASPTTKASARISRCRSADGAQREPRSIGSRVDRSMSAAARPPVTLPAALNVRPSSWNPNACRTALVSVQSTTFDRSESCPLPLL